MQTGKCLANICLGRKKVSDLKDPHVPAMACDEYNSTTGVLNAPSEYNQDWYIYYNFFRTEEMQRKRRTDPTRIGSADFHYVDIGASLPFEYSNTFFYDRCLHWKGMCVEPSPYMVPLLEGYRSCDVYRFCASDKFRLKHRFFQRTGEEVFNADCYPLNELLTHAGFLNQTIDILSLDIENQEGVVMEHFDFSLFDIRFFIIEVQRGIRWLKMDTIFTENGFAKIAVLGRDSIFAKLTEIQSGAVAGMTRVEYTKEWKKYHAKVIEDEKKAWKERG